MTTETTPRTTAGADTIAPFEPSITYWIQRLEIDILEWENWAGASMPSGPYGSADLAEAGVVEIRRALPSNQQRQFRLLRRETSSTVFLSLPA